MAVNHSNYDHRGGGNYGIVLRCPNVVAGDRLVYFDHNRDRGSWVLRDFVGEYQLDNNNSPLSVAEIEADAIYDEFPIWCGVETQPDDWKTYLTMRTTAVLKLRGPLRPAATPNPRSGTWQAI